MELAGGEGGGVVSWVGAGHERGRGQVAEGRGGGGHVVPRRGARRAVRARARAVAVRHVPPVPVVAPCLRVPPLPVGG